MCEEIKYLLNKKEIRSLFLLTIFAVVVSISEVFGLSMIVPFMTMVTNFKMIETNKYLKRLYELSHVDNNLQFIVFFGITIIIIFLLKNIGNIVFNYLIIKFNRDNYFNISKRLMDKYIKLYYQDFINAKASVLSKNILTECNNLMLFIQSVLFLLSDLIVIVAIYILMLFVSLKITIFVTIFLVVSLLIIKKTILNKIGNLGDRRIKILEKYYENVEKIFSNYKYIKLLGRDEMIAKNFYNNCRDYTEIEKQFFGMQPIPKNILEFLGFFIVVILIISSMLIYGEDGLKEIMSVITLFFLALYRILPTISKVVGNYQNILFYKNTLDTIVKELKNKNEVLGNEKISFKEDIVLHDITFQYGNEVKVLDNINLKINKGDRIAFIGESGAGKTTLADIIIGLHNYSGQILIDGKLLDDTNRKSWRSQIGYIPQEITLFYGTVRDNVVFGREYDEKKLESALRKARIWDFLQSKDGADTIVGDRGNMLSGGQRQRIGIARALYDDPEILVLDEATSALDNKTEKEIMDEIYFVSENRTLLVVAHRLTTLKGCNRIIRLKNRVAEEINETLDEIIEQEK